MRIRAHTIAKGVLIGIMIAAAPYGAPVEAQQSTYSAWQNPQQKTSDRSLQDLVDKLNRLIDKGERDRAADPAFLRDLRNLTRAVDRPLLTRLFSDEFLDGNYTHDPVWTVASGRYWVERGWGLRSTIDATTVKQAEQPRQRRSPEEQAAAIFGTILGQVLSKKRNADTSASAPAASTAAVIQSTAPISNTFKLEVDFSSWRQQKGGFQIAVYQGQFQGASSPSYSLLYSPGGQLRVLRTSQRGTVVIKDTTLETPLEDKKIHSLAWQRHRDGRMTVSIDGHGVLDGADQGFRDAFSGIALMNLGGDYIVKRLSVLGSSK